MGKGSHRLFLFVDKEAKHRELNLAGCLKIRPYRIGMQSWFDIRKWINEIHHSNIVSINVEKPAIKLNLMINWYTDKNDK